MNPKWIGDSYDLVKRVFIEILKSEGYTVYVDPMFTGNHAKVERDFYHLIGAEPMPADSPRLQMTAIFVDPDTGISEKMTEEYVTVQNLINRLKSYTMVMVFDQSFDRSKSCVQQMHQKLSEFSSQGVFGFFFDSHVKFFFGSLDMKAVEKHRCELLNLGIPISRFLCNYKTHQQEAAHEHDNAYQ